MATTNQDIAPSVTSGCEEWLMMRVGSTPRNSLGKYPTYQGWFRCGVGFYNKVLIAL
jgi:hypothetical protein